MAKARPRPCGGTNSGMKVSIVTCSRPMPIAAMKRHRSTPSAVVWNAMIVEAMQYQISE